MQALATAVFPVFLLILLGLLLRQRGWLADGFWEPAERLCYFVLLPALLLTSLAQADFAALAAAAVTGAVVLAIMAMTCLLLLVQLATRGDGPAFRSEEHTSELQSLMRISYAVFCLKKKKQIKHKNNKTNLILDTDN